MKIAILGDTHFDVSNSNERVLESQLSFFYEQFIPYLIENNISTVIGLGDTFDNRTKLGIHTLSKIKELFDKFEEHNIQLKFLLGNHDIFYKDSRKVNSMWMWDKMYPNISIIEDPTQTLIHDKQIYLVPWLLPEEKFEVPKVDFIFGHFEIAGAEMVKGLESRHGLSLKEFNGIPVFSGHFHLRRYYSNVYYVGTPYQANWNDYEETKGFHILDLETKNIEFVENVISPRHIKCFLDIENKTCTIEGLGESKEIQINAKTDYRIFENHKCKIFMEKDIQFSKKFVEEVSNVAQAVKIDIVKQEVEREVKEEFKDFSVVSELRTRMDTDYKKQIFEEIISEATLLLNE